MKAYRNEKGQVMAVFKGDAGDYGVYIQRKENDPFVVQKTPYPRRNTRLEAEVDLDVVAKYSPDKTWSRFELGGKPSQNTTTPPPCNKSPLNRKKRTKKYTDQQLFDMWQAGKTDDEIGEAVGVSRAMIQKWRDNMELPSANRNKIDTKKYQLVETEYGIYAVREDDI